MKVYMIYKMDFHYNQQLYKNHDKCKHIKEKKRYIFRRQGTAIVQYSNMWWHRVG